MIVEIYKSLHIASSSCGRVRSFKAENVEIATICSPSLESLSVATLDSFTSMIKSCNFAEDLVIDNYDLQFRL
ncbi:unnamed protein product [Calypogeia fissa]